MKAYTNKWKQNFDNYLKTNLVGKTKVNVQDSVTAKESQIDELLKDSNDRVTHKDHYDNDQSESLSHKDEKIRIPEKWHNFYMWRTR